MATPDLSEFQSYSQPRSRPCPVAGAKEQLNEKDRAAFDAALEADYLEITNAAISKWFEAREITVPWQNIRTHRSGTCNCGRQAS